MTQVSTGGTVTATYTYLGALRVKRQFGGTTLYVYAGSLPIAEYAAGAQVTQPNKEYIYSGSQLLATVDASLGTSYQYHDHLSTRVEADASANVTRTFGHFPFGETWYETGTASKWKFTSYERAETGESGLDYADFRFYSSRLGTFVSADLPALSCASSVYDNRIPMNTPTDIYALPHTRGLSTECCVGQCGSSYSPMFEAVERQPKQRENSAIDHQNEDGGDLRRAGRVALVALAGGPMLYPAVRWRDQEGDRYQAQQPWVALFIEK